MILLYPILKGGGNRFLKAQSKSEVIFRDGTVIALALLIMAGGFYGTNWMLDQLKNVFEIAYISPALPLFLVFLVLFVLLIISNIVSASGAFFLAEDLELLLASPLSNFKLFFQRFFITALSTGAISFVFILPIIASYLVRYHSSFSAVVCIALLLVPYFLIPAAIGFLIATGLAHATSVRSSKFFLLLFIGLFLLAIWYGIDLVRLLISAGGSNQDLTRVVKIFSFASIPWVPSTWLGEGIQIALLLGKGELWPRLAALYGVCAICIGFSAVVFQYFHHSALGRSRAQRSTVRYRSTFGRAIAMQLSPTLRIARAYIHRDLLLLLRDVSQLFQILLLGGVFTIYIYNLRIFAGLAIVGPTESWWQQFLFVSNFCMASFVSLAVCTRFVFPSISAEGRAFFPYLVKAPISFEKFLKIKFLYWYLIVTCIHSGAVALGVYASGGKASEIIIHVLISFILSLGIVSFAIGLGAKYCRFDWEHLSQLAVGYGNIIFMLTAAAWISLHIFPTWLTVSLPGPVWSQSRLIILGGMLLLNVTAYFLLMRKGRFGLIKYTN